MEQRELPLQHARLLQEIEALEARWPELGSALEKAEAGYPKRGAAGGGVEP